jgi:VWFA-related protein
MNHRKPLLIAGILIGGLILALHAAPQIRVSVHEVLVPVAVKDSSGGLVTNLEAEDFIVLEDHKRQTLTQFSTDPAPLSVVVLIDTEMGGNTLRTLSKTWGVLSKAFSPQDEVSTYRFDHFVTKLVDFTNDPKLIEKSFASITAIAANKPDKADIPDEPLSGKLPGWLSDALRAPGGGPPANPNDPALPAKPTPGQVTKLLHDAVYTAASDLKTRAQDRRKVVILITDGRMTGGNLHTVQENRNLLLREEKDPIQVYGIAADDSQPIMKRAFSVLDTYASPTGGDVYFANSVPDLAETFNHIVDQVRSQYVLSYVSNNEVPRRMSVFRTIDVKTTDPKLKVTHRDGYYQLPTPQVQP